MHVCQYASLAVLVILFFDLFYVIVLHYNFKKAKVLSFHINDHIWHILKNMFSVFVQPRHPMLKKRDDFEDILEERRRSSDLRYALRCYTPTLYKGLVPCKASMLKNIVLQSDHLQYVIKQVQQSYRAPTFAYAFI